MRSWELKGYRDQMQNEDQFAPGRWNTYICFELLIVKSTLDDIHFVFGLKNWPPSRQIRCKT